VLCWSWFPWLFCVVVVVVVGVGVVFVVVVVGELGTGPPTLIVEVCTIVCVCGTTRVRTVPDGAVTLPVGVDGGWLSSLP
jgi:hypothetical protein